MAADLRRFLDHYPISALLPGFLVRGVKWSQRHSTSITAALLGIIAVTAVLILLVQAIGAKRERDAMRS